MNASRPAVMPDFCGRRHPLPITTALMLLMKMDIDLERVDILAEGEHENYKGEVREQHPQPGQVIGAHENIVLKVGYAGAVDQLPYQFFYGLDSRSANRSADWEDRARRLMAPFDAAVIRRLAEAEFEELRHKHSFEDLEHITRFLSLFDIETDDTIGNLREGLLWAAMMPSFNQWAGNPRLVEKALECIFGYAFRIVENVRTSYEIPPHLQYRLGSEAGRLGRETVLGDTFSECDTAFKVVMKDVIPEDIRRFLPGQPGRQKLQQVLDICLPSHFTCRIILEPSSRKTAMGRESDAAYLGYSTYA